MALHREDRELAVAAGAFRARIDQQNLRAGADAQDRSGPSHAGEAGPDFAVERGIRVHLQEGRLLACAAEAELEGLGGAGAVLVIPGEVVGHHREQRLQRRAGVGGGAVVRPGQEDDAAAGLDPLGDGLHAGLTEILGIHIAEDEHLRGEESFTRVRQGGQERGVRDLVETGLAIDHHALHFEAAVALQVV